MNGKRAYALYFHADWCPICFALEKTIKAELDNLPKGTKILQVDYDNSDDLQNQYGVARQSTIVFVSAEGESLGVDVNPSVRRMKTMLAKSLE